MNANKFFWMRAVEVEPYPTAKIEETIATLRAERSKSK